MGTLYLVATPIGNLEDVTLRALRVLRDAAAIFAEDTRRTRVLLDRHGISARLQALHAHNEAARVAAVCEALAAGDVALVSDAGTPLVSDPGERLVGAVLAEGHEVVSIPGASAALAALTVSGLPPLPASVIGFLPRKQGERRALLERLREREDTLVFFESPRRLAATLAELQARLGDREACVARELTKLHEEAVRGPLSALADRFRDGARGEVTLVVAGAPPPAPVPWEALEERIRALLREGRTPREIAASLAPEAHLPRRDLYARAVAVREAGNGS